MVKVPVPAVAVMVGAPPQLLTTFGTAAITRLAGKTSLKVSPVRAGEPAGLVMVKVSVLACPTPIVAGANALVSAGRLCTVSPELTTLLVVLAVPSMLALVLLYGPPTTLDVTSTVTTHDACAALIAAPVTVTVPLPAAAVTTPVPDGHVVVTFGVAATRTLAGSVSVKLIPDCAGLPAPLVMAKVSVDVPPWLMAVGAKALFNDACTTVSVWLVTPLVSPPTVMLPAPLLYAFGTLEVTSTVTVHVEAPAAAFTPPPPMVKVPVPAVAVMVGAPPQLLTTFGTAAIKRLAGKVSLKVSPVLAGAPAGLEMVKVSVAVCPTPTVVGAKALVSAGRLCTLSPQLVTPLVTRALAPKLALGLLYGPPTMLDVTSTVTAHEACAAAIVAPVTVTVPLPAAAVTTPTPDGQVVVMLGAAATRTLAGSVSVKLMPDCAGLPAPLVSVKVTVEVPPWLMAVREKALFKDPSTPVSVWVVTPFG